jgi:hypothetical protein
MQYPPGKFLNSADFIAEPGRIPGLASFSPRARLCDAQTFFCSLSVLYLRMRPAGLSRVHKNAKRGKK